MAGQRRLFVSVNLPSAMEAPIAAIQSDLTAEAPGVDPVDPAQAHLTLSFLGDVLGSRIDEVERALATAVTDADIDPFEASLDGLGVFPSLEYIRVIWIGIGDGSDHLAELHRAIEPAMAALGFEPDDHAFTPHVTIARMRHAGGKMHVQSLVDERDPHLGTMAVEAVHLMESTLTDDGPVYDPVSSITVA